MRVQHTGVWLWLGLWCLCVGASGCYGPTHYGTHRGYFEPVGEQPQLVRWGERRWVRARATADRGRVYEVMAQPMCRRFERGRIRLVDSGGASKSRPLDGWVTLTTLSLCGGGALVGGAIGNGNGKLALAGAGLIAAPLTGILIYNLIPDYKPAQKQRKIEGGRWGEALVPCGQAYRVRSGVQVNARSPRERGSVQWVAESGQLSLSGPKRRALQRWSAACRHEQVSVSARETRRLVRRGSLDRYKVLEGRGRRLGRYGLAGKGLEPGRGGQPVRGVHAQSGLRETMRLRPRDGVGLPMPGGEIGRRAQRCEAERAQRIVRARQAEHTRCVDTYRRQLQSQCAEDCREAGDALTCQWEREDCQLIAEGTSVNCHDIYQKCMEREGLSDARVSACARSCADQISRNTCTLKAQEAEAAARQSEAIR